MTGEELGFLMERLLESAALDVWFTPIQMKKNRPATQVSALCSPDMTQRVARMFLSESTTLGVRISSARRETLARKIASVKTRYGVIRMKTAKGHIKPEFEDIRAAAREHGVPLRRVMLEAWRAAVEMEGFE